MEWASVGQRLLYWNVSILRVLSNALTAACFKHKGIMRASAATHARCVLPAKNGYVPMRTFSEKVCACCS